MRFARLPTLCAVCLGWARSRICADCLARHGAAKPRCLRCAIGVPAPAGGATAATVCGACLREPPPFSHGIAAFDYAFPWSRIVSAFKFNAALDLAPALSGQLADAARASGSPRPTVLVPVPLSPERLAERGMNQAWEIARRVGSRMDIACRPALLKRLIDTPHLADLPRAQRAARIRGAFGVAPRQSAHGLHIALVDDVMTSGATATEAARTLLAGGAASVQVWVVARTPAPGDA